MSDLEIKQAWGSKRIRCRFSDETLEYTNADSSGVHRFTLPYTAISRDRDLLAVRSALLRAAALASPMLAYLLLVFSNGSGTTMLKGLGIGLAFFVAYLLSTASYTVIPSEKGKIFILKGKKGDQILSEIGGRRAAQLRRQYDFVPESESLDQYRKRLEWLRSEGALTDDDVMERLEAYEGAVLRSSGDGAGRSPNSLN